MTSSRYISFIECSLIDNFSPDRHIGAAFTKWNKRMYGSGGVFGPSVGSTDSTGQDQGYGVVGRVTALPVLTRRALVHVGIAGSYLTPNAATAADLSDANQMRLRARPETHVNRGRFIDTNRLIVNYAWVVNDENAKGDRSYKVSDRFNTLQARFQLMF